ncbi:MAG: DUF1178 family protein [Alphaproteobacteria bacterium]|nr:DUF1178 family protein [Alphaproteobacteria bacterium]MBM3641183.1 DUF1178 family protein [Alphaproteobacteria bacterium]
MIRYSLICDAGHNFESWFRDSASFDKQAADGRIACPFCESTKIARDVMAPNVAKQRDDSARDLRMKLRELHDTVVANTEDVGDRFPEEARAMEDGETERRAIRGRATFEEAKALLEEGIEILPLPGLPGDGN